jgi:hypothetical protein
VIEPTTRTRTKVAQARDLLLELLSEGPERPAAIKAEARRRGLTISDAAWKEAKDALGVKVTHLTGSIWWWALPGPTLAEAFAAWLDSPEGRFAEYLVQRERSRPAQLALDVEEQRLDQREAA